jgi:hypothetical protein
MRRNCFFYTVRSRAVEGVARGPIRLGKGLAIPRAAGRPVELSPLLVGGGADETWKVVPHESLLLRRQAKWEELRDESGGGGPPSGLRAIGGRGCVELPGSYDDFVLQLTVRLRRPLANAGVFFRCMPGVFLDYEAQIFNGCYGHAPPDRRNMRPAPSTTARTPAG